MGSLSPANQLFVSQMIERIPLADSVISLDLMPVCTALLRQSKIDEEVMLSAQFVMGGLQRSFDELFDYCGGKTQHSAALPAPLWPFLGIGSVEITEIDHVHLTRNDWDIFGRVFLDGDAHFVEGLLASLSQLLGIGEFLFKCRPSGAVTLRLLPPNVYFGAAVFLGGGHPIRIQPTVGPSTLSEVRRMMEDDKCPLRLDPVPYEMHGHKEMHPYLGALYDMLRILQLARTPPHVRRWIPSPY
jgi:hypothetical protein